MLGDLVTLLLGHGPGRVGERLLQPRRRVDVFDLAAGRTDEVVVVARELLGELETAVVVGSGDPADDTDIDQSRHVPVGARLGQLGRRGDDLGHGQRTAGGRQGLDQDPPQVRVALVHSRPAGG